MKQITVKHVLSRAAILFAVSISALGVIFAFLLRHHLRLAQRCDIAVFNQEEPATCYHRTIFLVDWTELFVLLLLYFIFCVLATWLWFWTKHKVAQWAR